MSVEVRVVREVDMDKVIRGAVGPWLKDAMFAVHRAVTKKVPVSNGILKASLQPGGPTTGVFADANPPYARVGTNLVYGLVLDVGRRPGAKMPPEGALLEWMGKHGIPPEREFLVRRAISRRGITRHRGWFSDSVAQALDAIRQRAPDIVTEIKRGWEAG